MPALPAHMQNRCKLRDQNCWVEWYPVEQTTVAHKARQKGSKAPMGTIFNEVSSEPAAMEAGPAAMEAGRAADAFGPLEGQSIKQADDESALRKTTKDEPPLHGG